MCTEGHAIRRRCFEAVSDVTCLTCFEVEKEKHEKIAQLKRDKEAAREKEEAKRAEAEIQAAKEAAGIYDDKSKHDKKQRKVSLTHRPSPRAVSLGRHGPPLVALASVSPRSRAASLCPPFEQKILKKMEMDDAATAVQRIARGRSARFTGGRGEKGIDGADGVDGADGAEGAGGRGGGDPRFRLADDSDGLGAGLDGAAGVGGVGRGSKYASGRDGVLFDGTVASMACSMARLQYVL